MTNDGDPDNFLDASMQPENEEDAIDWVALLRSVRPSTLWLPAVRDRTAKPHAKQSKSAIKSVAGTHGRESCARYTPVQGRHHYCCDRDG